jgi:hypothetical protein
MESPVKELQRDLLGWGRGQGTPVATLSESLFLGGIDPLSAYGAPAVIEARKPRYVCPKTDITDPVLAGRYRKMWDDYGESVIKATELLDSSIARQSETAMQAGNLELVLLWREMQKMIASGGYLEWDVEHWKRKWKKEFGDAKFPSDFTADVKRCSGDYDEAKKMLEESYATLVMDITKANDLELAVTMRKEWEGLQVRDGYRQLIQRRHLVACRGGASIGRPLHCKE